MLAPREEVGSNLPVVEVVSVLDGKYHCHPCLNHHPQRVYNNPICLQKNQKFSEHLNTNPIIFGLPHAFAVS